MALAVVTGATGKVGSAISLALCAAGFRTAMVSRSGTALAELISRCPTLERYALPIECELTNFSQLSELMASVVEVHGPPSVVVHSASSLEPVAPFFAVHQNTWRSAFDDNVHSFANSLRVWYKTTLGAVTRFIYLTSSAARFVDPGESQYASAKAANEQLVKHARLELVGPLQRLLVLNPGLVRDDFQADASTPVEIARTVLWLGLDPNLNPDLEWVFQHDPEIIKPRGAFFDLFDYK